MLLLYIDQWLFKVTYITTLVVAYFLKFSLSSIKCLNIFSFGTLLFQQKAGMYGLVYQPLESSFYNLSTVAQFLDFERYFLVTCCIAYCYIRDSTHRSEVDWTFTCLWYNKCWYCEESLYKFEFCQVAIKYNNKKVSRNGP